MAVEITEAVKKHHVWETDSEHGCIILYISMFRRRIASDEDCELNNDIINLIAKLTDLGSR